MDERIILLAEDNIDDAHAVREALISAGITNRVIGTFDGYETIDYLKGTGVFSDRHNYPLPSVLLLDLKMPRVDGFEVLTWIEKHFDRHDMMIVVFSGFDDLPKIKKAYELGADSFLTKPCDAEDIRNLARAHKRVWDRLAESELVEAKSGV